MYSCTQPPKNGYDVDNNKNTLKKIGNNFLLFHSIPHASEASREVANLFEIRKAYPRIWFLRICD